MLTRISKVMASCALSVCTAAVGCGSSSTRDDDGATSNGGGGQGAGVGGSGAGAPSTGGGDPGAGGSGGDGAGGAQARGWTMEADALDFAQLGALAPQALFVDPHASGRVAIEFQHAGASPWFAIWEGGVFSKTFDDATSANAELGVFDANGHFYVFYAPTSGPVIARWPNQNDAWDEVALDAPDGYYPNWPPQGMTVSLGSPVRVGLYSGATFFDATGKVDDLGLFQWGAHVAQWSPSSLDGETWHFARFVPGESNELIVQATFSHAIASCALDGGSLTLVCTQVGALPGLATGVWMSATNPDQVLVRMAGDGGEQLWVSHDRGANFSPLGLPAGVSHFDLAVSPVDNDTLVLWSDGLGDLHVTHDLAASWTSLPLPETNITSLSGAGIDASGTLFSLRGGELFSRPEY